MKQLLLILCLFGTFYLSAQIPTEKKLVADETWVITSGKSAFRIISTNDSISNMLLKQFQQKDMIKIVYLLKTDRKGNYWEKSFYFKNESWNQIVIFIKKLS